MKTLLTTGDLRSLYSLVRQEFMLANRMSNEDAQWRAFYAAQLVTQAARHAEHQTN